MQENVSICLETTNKSVLKSCENIKPYIHDWYRCKLGPARYILVSDRNGGGRTRRDDCLKSEKNIIFAIDKVYLGANSKNRSHEQVAKDEMMQNLIRSFADRSLKYGKHFLGKNFTFPKLNPSDSHTIKMKKAMEVVNAFCNQGDGICKDPGFNQGRYAKDLIPHLVSLSQDKNLVKYNSISEIKKILMDILIKLINFEKLSLEFKFLIIAVRSHINLKK